MKHGVVALVGILVLTLAPVVAPAQGFLEGGLPSLPGLPSFGNLFGGGGPCDVSSCSGPFSLAGTVGWDYETVDLSLDSEAAGVGDVQNFKHMYRFQGLSLGLAAAAVSRTGVGAMARFSVLVVGIDKDTENYNHNLPITQASRHWNTKNDTYYFDGMGFYNFFRGAALVGGFRWNHLETSFSNPSGQINILGLPGDESVIIVNVFQPYVGAMIDQGGPSRILRAGLIGWPQLYGSVTYEETVGGAATRIDSRSRNVSSGYFWEIFGEYGLKTSGWVAANAAFSVFAKWTQYHIDGDSNVDQNVIGGRYTGE